jgi:hypothetical protein
VKTDEIANPLKSHVFHEELFLVLSIRSSISWQVNFRSLDRPDFRSHSNRFLQSASQLGRTGDAFQ